MPRVALVVLLAGLAGVPASPAGVAPVAPQPPKDKKAGPPDPPAGGVKDDLSRVLPVFDPGSHTQPVSAMGFTKDGSRLVTAGQDFTVQVWDTATGERVDVLRLPGYGREKGYDPGRWDVAAVSPDGTRVVVGGQAKFLYDDEAKANAPARLVLVDVVRRRVMRVQLAGNTDPVVALAFSPDGETLAVTLGRVGGPKLPQRLLLVGGLSARAARAAPLLRTQDCPFVPTPHTSPVTALAFAPDGKRLAAGERQGQRLTLWDVPPGAAPGARLAKEVSPGTETLGLAWAPDGKQFVHTIKTTAADPRVRGFDVRTADGELVKAWRRPDLVDVTGTGFGVLYGVHYLDANALLVVGNGPGFRGGGGGTIAGVVDLAAGTCRRLGAHDEGMITIPASAATADGRLVAYTVTGNTDVLIRTPDGKTTVRCGQRVPAPYYLGWAKDPARPGLAWTTDRPVRPTEERPPGILRHGFDLARVAPVGEVRPDQYDTARWRVGEWWLKGEADTGPADGFAGRARLMKGDKPVAGLPTLSQSRTLVPNGDRPPLVALKVRYPGEPEIATLYRGDGTALARLLPGATQYTDFVSSPDGRFLACTTGTPRVVVYRTDGSPYPLLSFAQVNGEWVCWTPEGYYAASPGGEQMFGWAVNNGPNELVTFYPAEKFAAEFRRPDVLRLAVEKGSVREALTTLRVQPAEVVALLPPSARLEVVEQRGATVKVRATARPGAAGKSVAAMRVMVDGKFLPDDQGTWAPAPAGPAEGVAEFEVKPGLHQVRVFARGEDGASALSDPVLVRGPKSPGSQPTLYRVCVGVNTYDGTGLPNLAVAAKDARDVYAALGAHCVGPENLFGAAAGELVVDRDATRARVLKALADARKKARPDDLAVVYLAGHGVKTDDGFYFVTPGAAYPGGLKGRAVSGDDLRDALAGFECPVVVLLDACQSQGAAAGLRPATDDLRRAAHGDTGKVTVIAAAMEHEKAGAGADNGHFTAALLKCLRAPRPGQYGADLLVRVSHLYAVVYDEVRAVTDGSQNPAISPAGTIPPPAVREAPLK